MIHLALDTFVLVDDLVVLMLVGDELIGAELELSLRRGLDLLGRRDGASQETVEGQRGGKDGDGKPFAH